MPSCHACGTEIPRLERVGRRDACIRCSAELHCCLNCRFYTPGMQNDCAEIQAERVVEKARSNFCDYFALGGAASAAADPGAQARQRLDNLFRKKT